MHCAWANLAAPRLRAIGLHLQPYKSRRRNARCATLNLSTCSQPADCSLAGGARFLTGELVSPFVLFPGKDLERIGRTVQKRLGALGVVDGPADQVIAQ